MGLTIGGELIEQCKICTVLRYRTYVYFCLAWVKGNTEA